MTYRERIIDEGSIREYLEDELGSTESFDLLAAGGGNANETFVLTWGDDEYVLRRPPPDEPVPEILHGVVREHEVLSALDDTWVPSPSPVAVCEDTDVTGSEFYVMERVEGEVIEDDEPERFASPDRRKRVADEIVDTLAKIHNIDHEKLGLGFEPTDAGRQIRRLVRQFDWASSVTEDEREVPKLDEVAEWLDDNAPETRERTLVHGDYKPDNLMFSPGTPPVISGVLDWEMCGVGDPLTDLGWLLSYWHDDGDPSPLTPEIRSEYEDHDYYPMLEVFVNDYSRFMDQPDYPTRREMVERYAKQTGIEFADEREERFYRALGVFKLACICEGFFRLHLEGSDSAKPTYPVMEMMVPVLAERASLIIGGDEPL